MALRLVHFSDIHITSAPARVPWKALLDKRLAGWVNLKFLGRYRDLAGAARITASFVEDVRRQDPDHILFTGDATGLSLDEEFEEARRILGPLLEAGRITGIPGNHDLYVQSAVRERRYERHLGEWEATEGQRSPPIERYIGNDLALICLKDSRPRPLHDSSGFIDEEQIERLEEWLSEPRVRDRVRIVALHYGPLLGSGKPDSRFHGLRNGKAFLEIVDRSGANLVVHGHLHGRFLLPRSPRRPVPLTTPGSLTHRAHDRAYHIYHVDGSGLRLEARRFEESTNRFVPWPDAPGAGPIA